MFIVIEGMDGVGKTSTAKCLSSKLDAVYLQTPPVDFENIRKVIHREGSRLAKYHFYISSVLVASERIKEILGEGDTVICDRYYHTTIINFKRTIQDIYPDVWGNLEEFKKHFERPDYVFLLTVDEETRKQRIFNRPELTDGDIDSMNSAVSSERTSLYKNNFDIVEIDTSKLSIDKVSDKIIKYINSRS